MAGECLSNLSEGDGEEGPAADRALEEQVGATSSAQRGKRSINSRNDTCNTATQEQEFIAQDVTNGVD